MLPKFNQPKGSTIGVLKDGRTVQQAFDELFVSLNGVLVAPDWWVIQGTTNVEFNGGVFLHGDARFQGKSSVVQLTSSTVAIVANSDGTFSPVTSYPTDGKPVVAHVREGSLAEVVGSLNRSAFIMGNDPITITWLPSELARITERFNIMSSYSPAGGVQFYTDYDITTYRAPPDSLTYHVDIVAGSDTSGDGSLDKPFRRIKKAIEQNPPARVIKIKGGPTPYTRDYTWNVSIVDRDVDIIGYGDQRPVLSGEAESVTFTPVEGRPGVYSATQGLAFRIVDKSVVDKYGHEQVLTNVASLAEVGPGRSFVSGSTITFQLNDSRAPDANVKLILQITNGRVQDNSNVYIENVEFRYSFRGFHAEVRDASKAGAVLRLNNCKFGLTCTENSFNSRGYNVVAVGCIAEYGMQDAWNYHSDVLGLGIKPWFIELNCIGRRSGFDMLPNNNGSTAHDGAVGIRIGGEYYETYGRVVHDVHDGTVTCNFNCTARDSSREGNYLGGASFAAGQGGVAGKARVYLYNCRHGGPNAGITKDGESEVWLFTTPIGSKGQPQVISPYHFIT